MKWEAVYFFARGLSVAIDMVWPYKMYSLQVIAIFPTRNVLILGALVSVITTIYKELLEGIAQGLKFIDK